MIVRFVDVGGIDDYQCLSFLFIINIGRWKKNKNKTLFCSRLSSINDFFL